MSMMKFYTSQFVFALAGAAVIAAAPALVPDSHTQPPLAYPIGTTSGATVKTAGRLFNIDGKVEYFAGTNAWWLGHLNNDTDVETTLTEIGKTDYKVVRVWGFGDVNTVPPGSAAPFGTYFHVLNSTGAYINYGTDGLQRLDYVVSAAERHGLKLVLNFVNNWSDMGGIAAYNAAFGGNATSWYTDSVSQKAYRTYVHAIVTRYKSSNAIFAWELANEPRCQGCPTSTIYNWASSISAYIKSLDSTHLVTLGDEGWLTPTTKVPNNDGSSAYAGDQGIDFAQNLKISTLDYGVFHLYPDSWGYNYTWGSEWISQHDILGAASGKPVILEEYGTPFPDNHTATELPWQAAVLKSGLAADQIWQFGTEDLSVSITSIDDVNTIVYGTPEYAVLGKQHADAMLAKKVVGT